MTKQTIIAIVFVVVVGLFVAAFFIVGNYSEKSTIKICDVKVGRATWEIAKCFNQDLEKLKSPSDEVAREFYKNTNIVSNLTLIYKDEDELVVNYIQEDRSNYELHVVPSCYTEYATFKESSTNLPCDQEEKIRFNLNPKYLANWMKLTTQNEKLLFMYNNTNEFSTDGAILGNLRIVIRNIDNVPQIKDFADKKPLKLTSDMLTYKIIKDYFESRPETKNLLIYDGKDYDLTWNQDIVEIDSNEK